MQLYSVIYSRLNELWELLQILSRGGLPASDGEERVGVQRVEVKGCRFFFVCVSVCVCV